MSLAHLHDAISYCDELRAALVAATARLATISTAAGGAEILDAMVESNRALLDRDPKAHDTMPIMSVPEDAEEYSSDRVYQALASAGIR
jgi:hypothetical protein